MPAPGDYNHMNMKVLIVVVVYRDIGVCVNDICDYIMEAGDEVSEGQVQYHLTNWISKGKVLHPIKETREGYFKNTQFYYPTPEGIRMIEG